MPSIKQPKTVTLTSSKGVKIQAKEGSIMLEGTDHLSAAGREVWASKLAKAKYRPSK